MEYFIDIKRPKRNSAGSKAPDDIAELCRRRGMEPFPMPSFPGGSNKLYKKIWLLFTVPHYMRRLKRLVRKGDSVLYQHPMYGYRMLERYIPAIQRKKGARFIALIHDLESLRKGIEGLISDNKKTNTFADTVLLKKFDHVICHNEHMKRYLLDRGFSEERLISLEIFDYLWDGAGVRKSSAEKLSVAVAGNLLKGKSGYVYNIFNDNGRAVNDDLIVHLYGINFDGESTEGNMVYHGSFPPDEIPGRLEGRYGLVWDGPSASTCAGNTGEYLKYNNPHKASLYLSSQMPVIVWSRSAVADFVKRHHVGLCVDSLYELETAMENISEEEYAGMCENTIQLSEKLRKGYYFYSALERATKLQEDT